MKVLMINKFLYPKGGAETYTLSLGNILETHGHQVQYFGLRNPKNTVGNDVDALVDDMDFSEGVMKNLKAPLRIVYNQQARKEIRRVLDNFQPDIVHLNNIQFHLTPSIILETDKWRKENKKDCKIIYTAHDYQLVCPSHGLFDKDIHICEKCLGGNYIYCFKNKCIKGSRLKSLLGTFDGFFWHFNKAYSLIDSIICPSNFLKHKLDVQKKIGKKTIVLHNYVSDVENKKIVKDNYVLEFGKLCKDKGTNTLLKACEMLPEIHFKFAGYGPAEEDIKKISNAEYVGFQTGKELENLIRKAKLTVYPSEWYENCPFSVIESQMYMTPVIASRIGGIPELIQEGKTGLLFEAGNAKELATCIKKLLLNQDLLSEYTNNCANVKFETETTYYEKLMKIYKGDM